jgi:hypothetical protein
MKSKFWPLIILLGFFGQFAAFSQTPPPNDNFSNSIVLTGTDVTFSGTLAGATVEDFREISTWFLVSGETVNQSVWWTWTAPTDTVLTLQTISYLGNGSNLIADAVEIYYATNGSVSPDGLILPALATERIDARFAPQTISVPVVGGSNYHIHLVGDSSAAYTFRLKATNTPLIVQQPKNQTVFSNTSTLFYTFYTGLAPDGFTFQWQHNGTNLPEEIAPIIAFTNINSSMAGSYSVIISNSAGSITSAPATLTISQSNFPVSLATISINSKAFTFSVSGESGRSYRLQSSTDLVNWTQELNFSINPFVPPNTSVFFNSNASSVLISSNIAARKFFRVTPYIISHSDAEICINNLREISVAKMLWQRANTLPPIATPTAANLLPYLPRHILPFCPDDENQAFSTSYQIGSLLIVPTCDISPTNHLLEAPQ